MLTSIVVNNSTDYEVSGEISLRDAVSQANSDAAQGISDTITLDPGLGDRTINLEQGQLEFSAEGPGGGTITLNGSGPGIPLTVRRRRRFAPVPDR